MDETVHFSEGSTWIGKPLSCLSDEIALHAHRIRSRPTIKAFPYARGHRGHQRVVSFQIARLRNPSHQVFTTVGGEVEAGEGWVTALGREFREELTVAAVHPRDIKGASILAMQTVSTNRPGWRSKLVVVVGVPVANLHSGSFEPKKTEIKNRFIGTICKTADRLRGCVDTPEAMIILYHSALSELRKQLERRSSD